MVQTIGRIVSIVDEEDIQNWKTESLSLHFVLTVMWLPIAEAMFNENLSDSIVVLSGIGVDIAGVASNEVREQPL